MAREKKEQVIVVGGGLAGIACAVALASRGLGVILVEARFALGGRAGSFEDGEHPGELLDNCQHVLLGCCTNLLDLYKRLGVAEKITFHKRVHFLDARGGRHDLWGVPGLPSPLHLGPAMALFSALSLRERSAVVRGMLAMLHLGRKGREELETVSFGAWLNEHRQPASLIQKFYDPIVVSALNEETRRGSTKYAIQVFQEAMLANREGYVVGLPNCPLGELYAKLPEGIDLRLNTRAEEIVIEGMRATGVRLKSGELLSADAVVLATNHHAVQKWMGVHKERDGRFAQLEKLESVPILGVHMWFDRPITPLASAALISGPLQWLFKKDAEGRVLHGVISAAREWAAVPKEEALRQFEVQIRQLFPAAREAKLERGVIVIEKRATFSPAPGVDAFRPRQGPQKNDGGAGTGGGGIQGLFLAGDYTKTDWPATMEGAVRSGYLAAEALAAELNMRERFLVEDLKIQWPAKILGL